MHASSRSRGIIGSLRHALWEARNRLIFRWGRLMDRLTYRLSQARYRLHGNDVPPEIPGPTRAGVIAIRPGEEHPLIHLPEGYMGLVSRIAAAAVARFAKTDQCVFTASADMAAKRIELKAPTERTEDLEEMKAHAVRIVTLKDGRDLDGLEEFCEAVMPEVERAVYGSYVEIEGVVVYRNPVCTLPEASATLWHADRHYDGVMKIMVYLNDVGLKQAPFEYLCRARTGALVRVDAAYPPRYPGNRIPPDVVAGYLADGYERHKVTGPKGTFMLFDEKNIHKGNYAEEGARDALVIQFRPTWKRRKRRIDPAWTKAMV